MAEKRQRIHLDASALICCIHAKVALKLQGKPEKDEVKYGNRLLYRLKEEKKNPEVSVVVSSEALGETLLKLLERYDKQDFIECTVALWDIFHDLELEYIPARKEANEIAIEIAKRDNLMRFSDCQIAACALSDSDSVALVTTDKTLIESKVLTEVDKELREEGKRREKLNLTKYLD
jgi:predicted nucleic acid-binding protein